MQVNAKATLDYVGGVARINVVYTVNGVYCGKLDERHELGANTLSHLSTEGPIQMTTNSTMVWTKSGKVVGAVIATVYYGGEECTVVSSFC